MNYSSSKIMLAWVLAVAAVRAPEDHGPAPGTCGVLNQEDAEQDAAPSANASAGAPRDSEGPRASAPSERADGSDESLADVGLAVHETSGPEKEVEEEAPAAAAKETDRDDDPCSLCNECCCSDNSNREGIQYRPNTGLSGILLARDGTLADHICKLWSRKGETFPDLRLGSQGTCYDACVKEHESTPCVPDESGVPTCVQECDTAACPTNRMTEAMDGVGEALDAMDGVTMKILGPEKAKKLGVREVTKQFLPYKKSTKHCHRDDESCIAAKDLARGKELKL
jgi:hypothetical protein